MLHTNVSLNTVIFQEIASGSKAVKTSFSTEGFDNWIEASFVCFNELKDASFSVAVKKAYFAAKEQGKEATFVAFLYGVTGLKKIDGKNFMAAILKAMGKTFKSVGNLVKFSTDLEGESLDAYLKTLSENDRKKVENANKVFNSLGSLGLISLVPEKEQ
jgi:hypothetical protein